MTYHQPVLAQTAVNALVSKPSGTYVDATFGGGGHSRLILERLSAEGRLLGIDQDPEAPLFELVDPRFIPVRANFRHLLQLLAERGIAEIDGLLADLGVSSHQLDTVERGFSYRAEAPLDLRMDPTTGMPACTWLVQESEQTLTALFREYGDLPQAHRLARAICLHRPHTTTDLRNLAQSIYGYKASAYLSQIFQALRIAINDEMGALEELLRGATKVIRLQGRLIVLTYHSGEARRIKTLYQTPLAYDPIYGHHRYAWKLLSKIYPTQQEIAENPRSRSATLWILQKLPV